ncbi:MAG: tetratricopeptide repeat protein [Planctomycetota bacterium]|jgi:DNA-directed RNA polymerase subunit alpha
MVSSNLDFDATFSTKTLTRENVITLKDQVYTSKDNYEALEKKITAIRSSLNKEKDTSETKNNTLVLGICLWILGNQEEAIETLTVLKTNKFACYFLGKCYQELEDYENALHFFERSKLTEEEEFHIQIDIAATQRLSGDFQGALKLIQKLSKGNDDEANLHYQWAHCLDNLGEYEEALTHYNRALEIDPCHSNSLFRLAYDYDLNGDDEKAFEYYKKCIEETPIHSNAMINLGLLYEDNDDYEKAISCYEAVLKSYPNHEIARLYLRDAKAGINMLFDEDKVKKQDEETEVLNIPISDFELSVRSKNCLERMNILTLADLTKVTEFELLSYKNFGETSLTEIKNILNPKGLRLGQAVEEIKPVELFIGDDTGGDEDNLSKTISEIELSKDCENAINEMGIETISDLVSKTETELLEQDGFTQAYIDELIDQLNCLGLKLHSENNVD